jgi:hypothetical protein
MVNPLVEAPRTYRRSVALETVSVVTPTSKRRYERCTGESVAYRYPELP